MRLVKTCSLGLLWFLGLVACSTGYKPLDDYKQLEPATVLAAPEPADTIIYSAQELARGKYMVSLLGCSICHTDGALVGEPDLDRLLAGSSIGIAYSSPLVEKIRAWCIQPTYLRIRKRVSVAGALIK